MIIQIFLGILNPFFMIKIMKDIYLYFTICKNQPQFNFNKIEMKFLKKSIKTVIEVLMFDFIYFPISLILNIIAFWTTKYNINLFI